MSDTATGVISRGGGELTAPVADASVINVGGSTLRDKLVAFRELMNMHLIERSEEIDAVLVALVAGENALFVGDPGTAKSMLSTMICDWIAGVKFEVLLSRFTTPEEVFGPISVVGLKNDEYRRILDGRMAQAHVAFLDEVFKASSAILNTLLQVLNERRMTNGTTVIDCPLKFVLGASNEWPDDAEELNALFDRFLIRRTVKTIQTARGRTKLLWSPVDAKQAVADAEIEPLPHLDGSFNPAPIDVIDVDAMQAEAAAIPFTLRSREAFDSIVVELRKNGIMPGDRRLRKAVGACRANAYILGEDTVTNEALAILGDILWDDPHEQPEKVQEIVLKVASPERMAVNALVMEAREIESAIDRTDVASIAEGVKKMQGTAKELNKLSSEPASRAAEFVKGRLLDLRQAALSTADID